MKSNLLSNWFLVLSAGFAMLTTSANAQSNEASYTVPAGDNLPNPVQIEMDRARLVQHGRRMILDYKMPQLLDGDAPHHFKLVGKPSDGDISLVDSANGVTAACSQTTAELSCVMKYTQGIDLNDTAAEAQLTRANLPAARIAELRAARFQLQHQAIGIIVIKR